MELRSILTDGDNLSMAHFSVESKFMITDISVRDRLRGLKSNQSCGPTHSRDMAGLFDGLAQTRISHRIVLFCLRRLYRRALLNGRISSALKGDVRNY